MRLSELSPSPGSKHKKKRVGRGPGSGWGKTAARGFKGQNSRAGGGTSEGRDRGGVIVRLDLDQQINGLDMCAVDACIGIGKVARTQRSLQHCAVVLVG